MTLTVLTGPIGLAIVGLGVVALVLAEVIDLGRGGAGRRFAAVLTGFSAGAFVGGAVLMVARFMTLTALTR